MAIISLSESGIKDFFVQRVTALFITLYFAYLLIKVFWLSAFGGMDYVTWHSVFMDGISFRILTLMAYLCIFLHAWIGIWIVCGDYIKSAWISSLIMLSFVFIYIYCWFWLFVILFFY